jgi:hypothetical protein
MCSQPPTANRFHLTLVGARRCRDRELRADASPTRPYPRQSGGFSGLKAAEIG